jgi:hypothetical protein
MNGATTSRGSHLKLIDNIERLLDIQSQWFETRVDKDLRLLRYHILRDYIKISERFMHESRDVVGPL